jgi:hypothetical protein
MAQIKGWVGVCFPKARQEDRPGKFSRRQMPLVFRSRDCLSKHPAPYFFITAENSAI